MTRILGIIVLLACVFVTTVNGQDVKRSDISGFIVDENTEPLESATLMLLNAEDSVLIGFTTTETDGGFKMPNVKAGNYIITINFQIYINILLFQNLYSQAYLIIRYLAINHYFHVP